MGAGRVLHAIVLVIVFAVSALSQGVDSSELRREPDLSALFPVIPGCVKTSRSLIQEGRHVGLEIIYEVVGHEDQQNNGNYVPCGRVTLRAAPSVRRSQEDIPMQWPPRQKLSFQGYDAWRVSPLCGNDPWLGAIEVLLDDDQSIEFSASTGSEAILDLANKLDLSLISDRIRIWLK